MVIEMRDIQEVRLVRMCTDTHTYTIFKLSCGSNVIGIIGHFVQDTLYIISFDPSSNSAGESYSLVID